MMTGKMKCGVYYGVKDVRVEEQAIPQITDDDVLVKVLRAGICGSDTGAFLHGGVRYGIFDGFAFGHEMVGRIVEKGANVADDLKVGDLVFVDPTRAKRAGMFIADMCGAFCEYVSVENAKRDYNLYVLKKDIDLDVAAIIEPLSVGTQGALSMNPGPDDNVVVLGAGTIGLCAAAGLINHGIKNVIVMDRNDWKLEKAAALGAKTINRAKEDACEKLIEYCGEFKKTVMNMQYVSKELLAAMAALAGDAKNRVAARTPNVSLYVDCAGAKEMLMNAFGLCADGTKYSIVSVYAEPLPINGSMFMGEPVIRGSAGYTQETIKEVIDHLENNRTPIKNIVTAKFPIDEFPKAMEAAAYKENHNIKVVIDYDL